ncbi:enoyl-CoA hydratase domain-containing protein 3, mitochondrial [Neocloeon triangulifer]|uniref:enoyl-CoA hydratase domain-containing protein 3, mitochondrial n=1 Tax=Neocloeon triangulifer TaxID=2078957 RepID=UPI00286F8447|nr:enoyl-CoA hydratase domain-containing protein 3, mitochondrial [Neocloeon triangulifer]
MNVLRKSIKVLTRARCFGTSGVCHGYNNLTKVAQENGVRKITLANPKKRNALSYQMEEDLIEDISLNDDDPSLRCIVIAAEGPVFSAGHDLKELCQEGMPARVFQLASGLMAAIRNSPVPIISAVNGLAAAAGCQLVAASDIVVCTEKSRFSTPGGNFGLFCSTPGVALVRVLPRQFANWMLYTGEPISAQQALQLGLVAKVCDENNLEEEVEKIVTAIKHKPRDVVALGKSFLNQQVEMDVVTAYRLGEKVMLDNLEYANAQEGLISFAEKRKPKWN